jgi:hypothetical protein
MTVSRAVCMTLALALAAGAQSPPKQWAGADEYDRASVALEERDPAKRIVLLREWTERYAKTEFERERLISFAMAYQQIGDTRESLKSAVGALRSSADDPSILLFIAALGPMLTAPTDSEVATISASAVKLLSISLRPKPYGAAAPHPQPTADPASLVDPETQRVLAFVRRLRAARASSAEADPEVIKRQIAEAALQWAKSSRP